MSLLSRDRLGIALYPDRLLIARVTGGWRRQVLQHKEVVPLNACEGDAPLWQPAIEALAAKAAAGVLARAEVTVVLSSLFARYALVPWSDALGGADEQLAFVRHCFARIYGEQADRWTFRLNPGTPGKPRIACALENGLVQALDKAMAPAGRAYRSLQPHLMASFNRWRARLGERPMWFITAEPGLLCLALLRDGQWQSVRAVKVGADWLKHLPALLAREECLVDSAGDCHDVYLFAPDGPDVMSVESGKWRIRNLLPTLLPGMAAGADAPYSIVVGV